MKKLFFILATMVSCFAVAQTSDTTYCIQLMSTRNIHLVKPEMVSMTYDTVIVQSAHDGWSRVLVSYNTLEEAEIMLWTWKRSHEDAFIRKIARREVDSMPQLFSWESNY